MPSQLNFSPMRALDDSAIPIPGALATFFETGTTTPVTVYTSSALTTPHPTPLPADVQGVFPPVFTDGSVALKVNVTTDALAAVNGFPIDPVQLISSTGSAASAVSFAPITGNDATNIQDAIQTVTTWQNTADDLGATSPFASAAQGTKADNAVSNDDIINDATLSNTGVNKAPSIPAVKTYIDTEVAAVPVPIKAWVNLDGDTTVTINASDNVSGVVRNAAGNYTVSFTTAMASASYGVLGSGSRAGTSLPAVVGVPSGGTKTTAAVQVYVDNGAGALVDSDDLTIMILQ